MHCSAHIFAKLNEQSTNKPVILSNVVCRVAEKQRQAAAGPAVQFISQKTRHADQIQKWPGERLGLELRFS